jgi:pimeloyl-ACP methyl ester carboxylesterase
LKIKIADGTNLNIEGDIIPGSKIIFAIHGAGSGAWFWRKMRDPLAKSDISLLAIDLPGRGESEGQGRLSVEEYRDVLRDLVKRLGLTRPIAMGHSMGGGIALDWAINYPAELSGLILVGTGARLRVNPLILNSIKENYDGYLAGMEKMAFGKNPSPEAVRELTEQSKKVPLEIAYNDFMGCDKFDAIKDVPKISLPTLILCGDADMLTPLKYSEFLRKNIVGSDLKIIPDAGHILPLEAPEKVAEEICRWLK